VNDSAPRSSRRRSKTGSGAGLIQAIRSLSAAQQRTAAAAVVVLVSLGTPWYSTQVVSDGKKVDGTMSGISAFSFVEAAVLLVAVAVLALVWGRATGRRFSLPLTDGTVITAAAGWIGLLVVYRLFDKPETGIDKGTSTFVGLSWGIFASLAAVGLLLATGLDQRRRDAALRAETAAPEDGPVVDPADLVEPETVVSSAGPAAATDGPRDATSAGPPPDVRPSPSDVLEPLQPGGTAGSDAHQANGTAAPTDRRDAQDGPVPGDDRGAPDPRYDLRGPAPRHDQGALDPRYDRRDPDPRYDPGAPDPRYDPREPDPRYDRGAPDPRYDRRGPDPRYDRGGYDPRYDRPAPDPRYDPREPDPRYDRGAPDPRYDRREPDPRYDRGGYDPRYDQGAPDPRYDRREPDPRYDRGAPDPRYDRPAPDHRYDQDPWDRSEPPPRPSWPGPDDRTRRRSEPRHPDDTARPSSRSWAYDDAAPPPTTPPSRRRPTPPGATGPAGEDGPGERTDPPASGDDVTRVQPARARDEPDQESRGRFGRRRRREDR
jgi:hypothetical protein